MKSLSDPTGRAHKGIQAGAIHRGFANGTLEAAGAGQKPELQRTGMAGVKPFNGDEIALHGDQRLKSGPR